ncbi:unnamed protein product, partial [Arabidopsis halleri]
ATVIVESFSLNRFSLFNSLIHRFVLIISLSGKVYEPDYI